MGVADPTDEFLRHRPLLFSIAYDLLAGIGDAEDVLQETWLSWVARSGEPVAQPRAYLVRIAVNHALARRAGAARRRAAHVGQWLPEPLVGGDAEEGALRAEACSMALLVVLETLSPLERAVFVLHDVFGYPHPEVAGILDRSPAAVRQLAHRARSHVHARRPRYRPDPGLHREVTERFLAAALGGDVDGLLRLLAPDVVLRTDGGGVGPATSPDPVHGAERVARLLVEVAAAVPEGAEATLRTANGEPAVVLSVAGEPFALLVLDLGADGVRAVHSITDPAKLPGQNRRRSSDSVPRRAL
jgi:RNA polymerase sigma factor (sigma-70 family)